MSPENTSNTSKLCPVCGTRVAIDSLRCLVCGADLTGVGAPTSTSKSQPVKAAAARPAAKPALQGSRMPEVTLTLPAILGLLLLVLGLGAGGVYFVMQQINPPVVEATLTPTLAITDTPTLSPTPVTPTATWTPEPSPTPFEYVVKSGDSCGSIAYAFKVSIQAIVLTNNLPADCSTLIVGTALRIPQPTPTATPPPTATLGGVEATDAACDKIDYEVKENDTLGGISLNYDVPAAAIREYNGMVNDVVRFGQKLVIPLCRRNATPGPTPTATLPPPYPPVNLLLPSDGAPFTPADGVITLQWASAGVLRENEAYVVTVEDLTEGEGRREVSYVNDTKFIVPQDFLRADGAPHTYRWWVSTVRQVGTDKDGNPIWDSAGAVSVSRVFTWFSQGAVVATPQP